MKTTLNIDDQLLRSAKKAAVDRGTTLTGVVEDALRTSLTTQKPHKPYKLRLKTHKGGLMPGVTYDDINSRERLYDIMDGLR